MIVKLIRSLEMTKGRVIIIFFLVFFYKHLFLFVFFINMGLSVSLLTVLIDPSMFISPQLVPVRCRLPPQCDVPWLRRWAVCGGDRRRAWWAHGRQLTPARLRCRGTNICSWSSPSASSLRCCWALCWCSSVPAARGKSTVLSDEPDACP